MRNIGLPEHRAGSAIAGLVAAFLLVGCVSASPATVDENEVEEPESGRPQDPPATYGDDDGLPPAHDEFTSINELEAFWSSERRRVVDHIRGNGWGLDAGGMLIGPGNLRVDTNDCPSDWSDGLEPGESLVIGETSILSGEGSETMGSRSRGGGAYVAYVNDVLGGVDGVHLDHVLRDASFVGNVSPLDLLLDDTNPFIILTLSEPPAAGVHDRLNESCIPHLMTGGRHPAWHDPLEHPWTLGGEGLSQATEAIGWGVWMSDWGASRRTSSSPPRPARCAPSSPPWSSLRGQGRASGPGRSS